MDKYAKFKRETEEKINKFPFMFAFSQKQLFEGMKEKYGLEQTETNKLLSIGAGGFILKADNDKLDKMNADIEADRIELMKDDSFVFQAMKYELCNHEFCITYDGTDALEAIGLTPDDIRNSERLAGIYLEARSEVLTNSQN